MSHIFTPENILAGVNQSLARMKTDYIDVLQFHASQSKEHLEEHGGLQTVLDLQKEGKIHYVGMSSTLPNLKDHVEMGVFDVFQIPYSALERTHENVINEASEAGAGIVIRGGAAKGGPGKEQGNSWDVWQRVGVDDLLGNMTRMEFIMRFTYTHPALDTTIVGTVNPGPPAGQHQRPAQRSAARRPLRRGEAPSGRRRLSARRLDRVCLLDA